MIKHNNKINILHDPVCGMDVNPNVTDKVTNFQGLSYYFCSESCRKAFETNPEDYLKGKKIKHKGIWGRYLDRLNKTTGGKPPQCHCGNGCTGR